MAMDLSGGSESPTGFLEREVFVVLLPGLEETLKTAKSTERRKRFSALDYLVEYLYKNNPKHQDRGDVKFEEIPFVKEEWAVNPRPPLPLSATLTEEQAAIIIQKFYRGYRARKQATVRVFRQWQRGVRRERQAITKIQKRWRKFSSIKFLTPERKKPILSPIPPSPLVENGQSMNY